ncbi:hypothetical protein H6G96_37255 [Nostoc sp. FACHB-892]|uniref:hypothetical protein n=1 Tax=Nostoc sp. FACHB-892 TaxID=2692843 RepID=UPI0016872205|nr:hypothetical protein [Nostoc sp. FACHB-892]MBD2731774.1 hypothetical protein [Nostoc sp. FACHB-892]
MKWLEPWWATEGQAPDFRETFERQLEMELSPKHKLYGVPVKLIGRHGGSDDALFELSDGSGRVTVVHLTWARSPEMPPWPVTAIYESFEAWSEQCMKPEHEEWVTE